MFLLRPNGSSLPSPRDKATSRSTFLRRPVAAILVEDEARYRSPRIVNKGDLCVHVLGEEVAVALRPKLHRGRAARCAPAAASLPQQALRGWLTIALIERITLNLRATRPPAQGLLDEVAGETATGPTP